MVGLADVRAARDLIATHIRTTPLIPAYPVKQSPGAESVFLKLECMQISGSFKARGAVNKMLSLPPEQLSRGLVTASGGNHGLGVAYAGWIAKAPVTIYLPHNTPPIKAQKLESWGAKVVMEGDVWDDANRAALATADRDGLAYIHPFADETVVAGQGTIALEIAEALPQVGVVLVAIGGGGLISGVSMAIKALKPSVRVIGVEPFGAPTLYESLKAGKPVELASIATRANTLAPRATTMLNYQLISQNVSEVVLVSDEEMQTAAQWLWFEMGVAVELSGAAAMAALLSHRVTIAPQETVCVLVCGAGTDGMS